MKRDPFARLLCVATAIGLSLSVSAHDSTAESEALSTRPNPDGDWAPLESGSPGDPFEVFVGYQGEDVWIKVVVDVDRSPRAICRMLADVDAYPAWYPGLVRSHRIVGKAAEDLVYGRIDAPWPFRDREYVARQTWRPSAQGLELETRAVSSDRVARNRKFVRLNGLVTLWRVDRIGNTTRIEYLYREGGPRSLIQEMLIQRTRSFASALVDNIAMQEAEVVHGPLPKGSPCLRAPTNRTNES